MRRLLMIVAASFGLATVLSAADDLQSQPPKPGSEPRFNTPFGYYVDVLPTNRTKLMTYCLNTLVLGGSVTIGGNDAPSTVHKADKGDKFVYVRFHKENTTDKEFFEYKEVRLTADGKDYKPIALSSPSGLEKEYIQVPGGIAAGASSVPSGDWYWVFKIPDQSRSLIFHYLDRPLEVTIAKTEPREGADKASAVTADRQDPGFRTWTDITGKYKIEAMFVEFKDGKVQLKKKYGNVITLPKERLSKDDQEWVTERVTSQVKAEPQPVTKPEAGAEEGNDHERLKGPCDWQNVFELFLERFGNDVLVEGNQRPVALTRAFERTYAGKEILWTLRYDKYSVNEDEI